MTRKVFIFALMLTVLLSLFGCGDCRHDWNDADCLTPKTCKLCVQKMLESCEADGNGKYKPAEISGYTQFPSN